MRHPVVRMILGALAALALTLANQFIGERVALPRSGTLASHLVSLAYLLPVLLSLMVLATGAAQLSRSASFLALIGIACAAPVATVFALAQFHVNPPLWLSLTANNLFGPISMVLLGAAIARIFRHSNTLLVGAGFGLFFDIVVVTMGPVAHLLRGGDSGIIAAVSVGAGAPRTDLPSSRSVPLLSGITIGPADVLFIALFLAAVVLLERKPVGETTGGAAAGSARRTFWWIFGLLALALTLVEFTALPVPALAPMGVAVLIANFRNGAFTTREKKDLAIGGVFALFCAALIVVGANRLSPVKNGYGLSVRLVTQGKQRFALVDAVASGSAADKSGIKAKDRILALNGRPASDMTDDALAKTLAEASVSGVALVVLSRGQRPRDVLLAAGK